MVYKVWLSKDSSPHCIGGKINTIGQDNVFNIFYKDCQRIFFCFFFGTISFLGKPEKAIGVFFLHFLCSFCRLFLHINGWQMIGNLAELACRHRGAEKRRQSGFYPRSARRRGSRCAAGTPGCHPCCWCRSACSARPTERPARWPVRRTGPGCCWMLC